MRATSTARFLRSCRSGSTPRKFTMTHHTKHRINPAFNLPVRVV